MRKLIEASLVLALATVITFAIMAVIFPRHVRGGGQPAFENTKIWPAVFVQGTHQRPGIGGGPMDPRFAKQPDSTGCPYLAAPAAKSKCPATPRGKAGIACPYLLKLHRQLIEPESAPATPLGQHI
mgnify:CR=1 FL=1